MDALQRLIQARMAELHRSYGDIARLGGLPRSTVHHLATHARSGRLPNPATLERLAAGLDLPLEAVRAAAAQAAGLVFGHQPVEDPETEVLIASLARLSPADRRHVAALVRSLLGPPEAAASPAAPPGQSARAG
jgi:HEAT repeat protein